MAGRASLLLRAGGMLAAPGATLRYTEAAGGGLALVVVLALGGILCLSLEDVAQIVVGLSHRPTSTVLSQLVSLLGHELNEVAMVVVPAAVALTVLAGRGRSDPSADLELGAACYVPFFAVRAVYRALDAVAGPLPDAWNTISIGGGAAWAAATAWLALRVARARPQAPGGALFAVASGPRAAPTPPRTAKVAGFVLAAVLASALAVHGAWVITHGDAIRPLRPGEPAPLFVLPNIDGTGGNVELESLRGRVVLLDFWATWCPPCVEMMPMLHELHRDMAPRGFTLVGINSDGASRPPQEVLAFVKERRIPYPVVLDDGRANQAYRVRTLPHLVLIRKDGRIEQVFWGYTTRGKLMAGIQRALARS